MAFFYRINQSKLKHLSNQFKRNYFQISYASSSLESSRTKLFVSQTQDRKWIIPRRPVDFCDKVRFFAAPVQVKVKKEEKDTSGPRLNDKIKAEIVRLVFEDGHEIVSLREALGRARELKVDLVEVQRNANPPVCKLMDFHREKYKQQLKDKDRVKIKAEVSLRKGDHKEVRFSGKTEEKDLRMKADMVKRLMERGYRVKCTARGTEDQDLGALLSRLSALIDDVSVVESGPRVERVQAYVIVRHAKFGPSKKGGGKKPKAVANSRLGDGTIPLVSDAQSSSPVEVERDNEESVFEADVEESNDFNDVFDFEEDANGTPSKTTGKIMNSVSDRASQQSRPSVDSGKTSPGPHPEQDSSIKTENRYQKIEPVNRFRPTNGMDNQGRGTRDTLRSETQIRDQRRPPPTRDTLRSETQIHDQLRPPLTRDTLRSETQIRDQWRPPPTNTNISPFTRESKTEENNTSFRNVKLSPNETSRQGLSHNSDPSPSKPSYGIFSSQNVNSPGKQDATATSYRGNQGPPITPGANPNAPRASDNTKFPSTKPDDNLNKGQRSWGIFSQEGSKDLPNRLSKP